MFQPSERTSHHGVTADTSPVRVLVVDDSEVFQQVMSQVVAQTPGFEVVRLASSGHEALDLLAHVPIHLVLLDRHMPEMDGIETAHRIHERHPDIVTLILTATPPHTSARVRSLAIEDKRNLSPEWLAAYWQRRTRRR